MVSFLTSIRQYYEVKYASKVSIINSMIYFQNIVRSDLISSISIL